MALERERDKEDLAREDAEGEGDQAPNLFHFFDESQSEKIVRKMRIEFRYASE